MVVTGRFADLNVRDRCGSIADRRGIFLNLILFNNAPALRWLPVWNAARVFPMLSVAWVADLDAGASSGGRSCRCDLEARPHRYSHDQATGWVGTDPFSS